MWQTPSKAQMVTTPFQIMCSFLMTRIKKIYLSQRCDDKKKKKTVSMAFQPLVWRGWTVFRAVVQSEKGKKGGGWCGETEKDIKWGRNKLRRKGERAAGCQDVKQWNGLSSEVEKHHFLHHLKSVRQTVQRWQEPRSQAWRAAAAHTEICSSLHHSNQTGTCHTSNERVLEFWI